MSKRSAELRVRISSIKQQKVSIFLILQDRCLSFYSQRYSEDAHWRQTAHRKQSEMCSQFSKASSVFLMGG